MPMLNLISITCVKRDDDGRQHQDEPYLTIVSDRGDRLTSWTSCGSRADRRQGRTITEFAQDRLGFENSIDVMLLESDHETIGAFSVSAGLLDHGVQTHTLKRGKDAHYELRYTVEAGPEDILQAPFDESGDRGEDASGNDRSFLRLQLDSLRREPDHDGSPGNGAALVRLEVNGFLLVNSEFLSEGEEALDAAMSRRISPPLNLVLEERDGQGQWIEVARIDDALTEAAPGHTMSNTVESADGHRYSIRCQIEPDTARSRRALPKTRPLAQPRRLHKPGPAGKAGLHPFG